MKNRLIWNEIFIARYNSMQNINCMIIKSQSREKAAKEIFHIKVRNSTACDVTFDVTLEKNRDNFI